jgi:ADP-ribosylglycohydrolase
MAERYGLARTASVLRLDYYRLKKRLDENAAHRSETVRAAAKTTFIELPAPVQPATAECVVELEDGVGAKMRIHLKGGEAPDLAALSRSFWRGES